MGSVDLQGSQDATATQIDEIQPGNDLHEDGRMRICIVGADLK